MSNGHATFKPGEFASFFDLFTMPHFRLERDTRGVARIAAAIATLNWKYVYWQQLMSINEMELTKPINFSLCHI